MEPRVSDIVRIILIVILIVIAAWVCSAAEQTMKIDSYTHSVIAPPASAGATYDFDFTGRTVGGISGGSLSDGDKGDITVSGSGTVWTIDSGVVTLSKLATIATDSVLGRATTGTGAPEVLTALPWAFTGDVTSIADANALTIANNAVSLAKMADIATDSILGRATAATGDPEVLTALPFAFTGDVTRPADSNAQTIVNDAVTLAKIQNAVANSKLLGSGATGAGADYVEITLGTNLSMSGTTLNAASGAAALNTGQIIRVDSVNGNDGTGVRGRYDLPFLTISGAIGAAGISSGDIIVVGPGTFTENSGFSLPNGVSLVGSGIDVTKIQSTLSSINKAVCTPGNNSIVAHLTITNSATSSIGLGCGATDQTFTGAIAYRVKVAGQNDAIYFHKAAATSTLTVYDSIITSVFDTTQIDAGSHELELWNCDLTSDGGAVNNVRALTNTVGVIRAFNCKLTTKNAQSASQNCPIYANGGTIEAHNCRISSDGTGGGGIVHDLRRDSGTLKYEGISRDDGAALTTTGTLTPLISVLTGHLTNDSVTLAKIQNATANSKLLGSGATGSGADYSEITLGTNLSMSGTTLNASGGSTTFTGLTDTPSSYTGQGTKLVRVNSGETALEFVTATGGGDVFGPASSTDNAVVRFDGTTGKTIQNSAVTIADTTGLIAGARFANAGLKIQDADEATLLTIRTDSVLSAPRTLTLTTSDQDVNLVFNTATASVGGTNTGDQTITLTGDVTGSGTGSFAATIGNDKVTYAKMQNVSATDRLLGRDTAAAGDVEELTVGGGIEFTGSGGIQTSAFTGDVTKTAGGTATTLVGKPTGAIVGTTDTQTLTSKRIDPRTTTSATNNTTPTPDVSTTDEYIATAMTVNMVFGAPTGTPVQGTKLLIRIKDNGTARTIGWNATYVPIGVTLPTTTVSNKLIYVGCVYNSTVPQWDVIAVTTEA